MFYGPHHDLVNRHKWLWKCSAYRKQYQVITIQSFRHSWSVTNGAGTAYTFGAPNVTHVLVEYTLFDLLFSV